MSTQLIDRPPTTAAPVADPARGVTPPPAGPPGLLAEA
jgi:hypothetical protein